MQNAILKICYAPLYVNRNVVAQPHTHLVTRRQQHQPPRSAATGEALTRAPSGAWPIGCEIRMLYDGECSLCMKEVNFLRKRDTGVGKIDFVDIAAPTYRAEDNSGITFEQAMERIHAILPDGTIVRDVEVFRRLYEAVGLGWVYGITKNKAVLDAANAVYGVWAKYRTQITGREAMDVIIARHKADVAGQGVSGSLCRDAAGNLNQACELPQSQTVQKQ